MALFGRRRRKKKEEDAPAAPSYEAAELDMTEETVGPRDSEGLPAPSGYVDLGALYVPRVPGLQLRGKFEQDKDTLSRMLLVLGASGITASVAAAPKSGDVWPELLEQIEGTVSAGGGSSQRVQGRYGTELHAKVAGNLPDGTRGLSPLRIIGVEGPRWLIRLDIQGAAISGDEDAKQAVEDLIDQLVVNRGPEPKIRFELLPFSLPREAVGGDK